MVRGAFDGREDVAARSALQRRVCRTSAAGALERRLFIFRIGGLVNFVVDAVGVGTFQDVRILPLTPGSHCAIGVPRRGAGYGHESKIDQEIKSRTAFPGCHVQHNIPCLRVFTQLFIFFPPISLTDRTGSIVPGPMKSKSTRCPVSDDSASMDTRIVQQSSGKEDVGFSGRQ